MRDSASARCVDMHEVMTLRGVLLRNETLGAVDTWALDRAGFESVLAPWYYREGSRCN